MTPFYDNVRRIDFDGNIFPDRYVRFRRTFLLDKVPDNVLLRISAESGFAVYLNGKRLEMTQYPDFPDRKTVSEMNVSRYLKPGNNVIGILVFRLGYGCLTNIPSSPGLVVNNRVLVHLSGGFSVGEMFFERISHCGEILVFL